MKIINKLAMRLTIALCALTVLNIVGYVEVHAAGVPIARLTNFSGDVLIKNKDAWGATPRTGLSLYSEDKIVTRNGTARVEFHDGAIMEVSQYANLLIKETETRGWFRGKTVQRSFRLALGKIRVVTGAGSNVQSRLETPTAVCGLRGTDVTLSLDSQGRPYIHFDSGTGTNISDFISGVATLPPDLARHLADQNPAQRAAYLADQAARQAAAASVGDAQNSYNSALAAAAAAAEIIAASMAFIDNPELAAEMRRIIAAAQSTLRNAQAAMNAAIANGATPSDPTMPGNIDPRTVLDYLKTQLPELERRFDLPESPIQDTEPPSLI